MMINRKLKFLIENKLGSDKAIFVIGPRQTGKTTLLKQIAEENLPYSFLDGDDPVTRELLNTPKIFKVTYLSEPEIINQDNFRAFLIKQD